MSRQTSRGVGDTTLRSHCRVTARLPAGRFHISTEVRDDPEAAPDVTYCDVSKQAVVKLHWHGIIEEVGRIRTKRRSDGVSIWHCRKQYRDRAQEMVEALDGPVPACPHTGLRNIPGGGYTCTDDTCDVEVSREEVQR
jgi:hypothetical protein